VPDSPTSRPRSLLASVIGWLIVAVIVYFFFGWILGTIRVVLRLLVIVVVLGALFALYFKVRGD
jgi:ribose/xylose/arabinose/galactoside ABC-type transport system permease subunit